MKNTVLVLNRNWFPIGISNLQSTFVKLFSGMFLPIDIEYEVDEDGNRTDTFSQLIVIKNIDEWLSLPVRDYDEVVKTVRGEIRVPSVVVCSNYDGIPYKEVYFPTKNNILKRDKYICGYSGIKLNAHTASIDHIFPKSRCAYNPNTWENQVACHKELNSFKSDRLPEEVDLSKFTPKDEELAKWVASNHTLKLRSLPSKPERGLVFCDYMENWGGFLKNM